MRDVVLGAVAGGAISLSSAVSIDLLRSRRERRQRWDDDQMRAMQSLIASGREYSERQYFCGRCEYRRRESVEREAILQQAIVEARHATLQWHLSISSAQLLLPSLRSILRELERSGDELKDLAKAGFDPESAKWADALGRFDQVLERLAERASRAFGIERSWAHERLADDR